MANESKNAAPQYEGTLADLVAQLTRDLGLTPADDAPLHARTKAVIEELDRQRLALKDEAWNMHTLWMVTFTLRAQEKGLRGREDYTLMTEADRAANRHFNDVMHPIVNPHLRGQL